MCNKIRFWIGMSAALCIAVSATAQQASQSVADILKELSGDAPAASSAAASAKENPAVEKPAPAPAAKEVVVQAEVPAPVIEPEKAKAKDETVLRERQDFESVKEKGTGAWRAEWERRKAETEAIEAVEAAWNGLVMRDYALSRDAVAALKASEATDAVDVSSEFPEVKFPKGAYAIYRPGLHRLFVQNTLENMERFESLLPALDAPLDGDAGQVKIETRFVEFSEGALEELGFEWSSPGAIDLGGDWAIDDATQIGLTGKQTLFGDALRSVPYTQPQSGSAGVAGGLAEILASGDWTPVPQEGDWRAARLEDTFSDTAGEMNLLTMDFGDQFDLLLRAMDQTSGTDLLSAPNVVTRSGEEAVITVGELHHYPEVYEDGVSDGTVIHVRYEDFEPKMLGVEMTVRPFIQGETIQLEVNPKITDLIGWEQFTLAPADSSYNYYQAITRNAYIHEAVVAKLPIFKRREIKTEIAVQSGSTVGLGGLITEKLEAFDDRVPLLGSLPLVGRLFRSEGERTVKKNLMIFLTATKVEPNGRMAAGTSFE